MKINKDILILITGKNTEGIILMVPIYKPNLIEYLTDKYINSTDQWPHLKITNPENQVLYERHEEPKSL